VGIPGKNVLTNLENFGLDSSVPPWHDLAKSRKYKRIYLILFEGSLFDFLH
jgi:hypothetical protein